MLQRIAGRGRAAALALTTMVLAATLSIGGCPGPDGNGGDGQLEGTWNGDVTYTEVLGAGGDGGTPQTYTRAFTVTFTAEGQPDKVPLAVGVGDQPFEFNVEQLVDVGDQATANFERENPNTGAVTTTTITATVTSVSRSDSAYALGLDLDIEFSGATTGQMTGTYSLDASIQDAGNLAWIADSTLNIGSELGLVLTIESDGTLSKQ